MPARRPEAVRVLEVSAEAFRRAQAEVSEAAWSARPAPDRWSPAELVEHLALVETSTLKLVTRKLFAEPAPAEALAEAAGKTERLTAFQESPTRRVAPDFVTPRGKWPGRGECVAAFEEARAAMIEAYRNAPADLERYAAPHPMLGQLDGFQWALFLALHLERHLGQLRERVAE